MGQFDYLRESETLLVFDIETLDEAPPAGLIELGWTSVRIDEQHTDMWDFAYGELEGEMLFGIPEGQTMSPANRAVHHINPAELAGLPVFDPFDWAGPALGDVRYGVAHNSSFEEQWLGALDLEWVCTYKCALRQWPDAPSHSNQALKYFLGPLQDGPQFFPPHRALPDAKVTALILGKLLEHQELGTLLQWTREPRLVSKMGFGKHKGKLLKELPTDYLEWVANPAKCEAADEDLRFACRLVIQERRQ